MLPKYAEASALILQRPWLKSRLSEVTPSQVFLKWFRERNFFEKCCAEWPVVLGFQRSCLLFGCSGELPKQRPGHKQVVANHVDIQGPMFPIACWSRSLGKCIGLVGHSQVLKKNWLQPAGPQCHDSGRAGAAHSWAAWGRGEKHRVFWKTTLKNFS